MCQAGLALRGMASPPRPSRALAGSTFEVFRVFLMLGLTSFGGPIAHLGYFRRELVERRRWLDEAAYADLVALCQFLPGPASSQVGIAIGRLRAGYAGAFSAWVAFTLPSALLMLAFACGLTAVSGPVTAGAIHGLKLAAVAIVAQAVLGMAASLAPDWPRRSVALGAAVVLLVVPSGWMQLAVISAALVAGWLQPAEPATGPSVMDDRRPLLWLAAFAVLLVLLPMLAAATGDGSIRLFDAFYRTGALVFGGGHVVLPLLEAELVTPGFVTPSAFLAGYGAAQALPGPLFAFAVFAGAESALGPGGWLGGTLALVAIYVPSFLLVFGSLPYWQALRAQPRARNALAIANAAVVGLLLAALVDPVVSTSVLSPLDAVLALAALALLVAGRLPYWTVVLALAGTGALFGAL